MVDWPLAAEQVVALVVEGVEERIWRRSELVLLFEALVDDEVRLASVQPYARHHRHHQQQPLMHLYN